MARTSQLPVTVVEMRLPGAVAPINGIGMRAAGMSQPDSAR
jgi:hypothetical protein